MGDSNPRPQTSEGVLQVFLYLRRSLFANNRIIMIWSGKKQRFEIETSSKVMRDRLPAQQTSGINTFDFSICAYI